MNNFFIISETASYLNERISGCIITEVFSQEKNKLMILLVNENGSAELSLEFSTENSFNYLVLRESFSKAAKNYANLFPEITGMKILSVGLLNNDRLIKFNLNNGFIIVFSFFTIKSNCFLLKNDNTIYAFKESEKYKGVKAENLFPQIKKTPSTVTCKEQVIEYLKSRYRKYGYEIIQEVIYKMGLNENELLNDILKENIENSFRIIDNELKNPVFMLYKDSETFIPALINLSNKKYSVEMKFNDVNELITECIKLNYKTRKINDLKSKLLGKHELKLIEINKKIRNLNLQLNHCQDAERMKISGDLIFQNLDKIIKGDVMKEFINEKGDMYIIKLKPELSPAENAQLYFEKFKKQKLSVKLLNERIHKAEDEKQLLEKEIHEIKNEKNIKQLMKDEKQADKKEKDETSVFRKFILSDKYEVWIGKDSRTNDLLTTRFTLPHEIWFHVRGASGSHTVLKGVGKNDDVPKEFITKAASLAAYYSKARNASSVPVAYCEKKYVRKKKGFKQGSVTMEREKVIFVKPSLPEES